MTNGTIFICASGEKTGTKTARVDVPLVPPERVAWPSAARAVAPRGRSRCGPFRPFSTAPVMDNWTNEQKASTPWDMGEKRRVV